MSATIHVELPCACEGDELVEFLAERGLTGEVASAGDHCEIDVRETLAPDERLRHELECALRSWLAVHERPLVPLTDRAGGYVLRPPGD